MKKKMIVELKAELLEHLDNIQKIWDGEEPFRSDYPDWYREWETNYYGRDAAMASEREAADELREELVRMGAYLV